MIYNLPKNIDLIIDFITMKPEAKKRVIKGEGVKISTP